MRHISDETMEKCRELIMKRMDSDIKNIENLMETSSAINKDDVFILAMMRVNISVLTSFIKVVSEKKTCFSAEEISDIKLAKEFCCRSFATIGTYKAMQLSYEMEKTNETKR